MPPPTIENFLGEIAKIVQEKNGAQLQDFLILEPPLPPLYQQIVHELRVAYPPASQNSLEQKIKSYIPENEEGPEGGSRSPFILFMVKYFVFLRDVNVDNLVDTHDMLKALLNQCILALGSFMGLVVLPTVISLSRTLARLAIDLDKRPELVAHLTQRSQSAGGEEGAERITLVEGSANVIREAFKKCLSERSGNASGVDNDGKPEGRRIGIYLTANLCLKLFFHCRKLRSAEQIFGNIYSQSPPLSLFPAPQRVTYLYYLGRYLFANSHFYRAQTALQEAYDQCPPQYLSQRRQILIYLTTSNIILGRFPTQLLYQRPESLHLHSKFHPITTAIAYGDLATFRRYLSLDSPHAQWFLRKRILLQLLNRCEILVWRSLARRTFLLSGSQGDALNKRAPNMQLQDMLTLATYLETRALSPSSTPPLPTPEGHIDPDLLSAISPDPNEHLPTLTTIESVTASLISQDLLHGFISHASSRFAITGARNASPLSVGFPRVWDVVKGRADGEVPGWVRGGGSGGTGAGGGGVLGGGKLGGGMVVNLSGVRAVGVGAG